MKLGLLFGFYVPSVLSQVYSAPQLKEVCARNESTCEVICYNFNHETPETNTCQPSDLAYECLCRGGYRPSLKNNTLPAATARCQIEGQRCKEDCNGVPDCAVKCDLSHVCVATEDPTPSPHSNTTHPTNSTTNGTTKETNPNQPRDTTRNLNSIRFGHSSTPLLPATKSKGSIYDQDSGTTPTITSTPHPITLLLLNGLLFGHLLNLI